MLPCRRCHRPVVSVAEKCCHCGQVTPIWTQADTFLAFIKLIAGLALFAFFATCMAVAC